MKDEVLNVSQSSVAQALAADYFCIYYVNVSTNKFIEYKAAPEYRALGLPTTGDDIITFARTNFEELIHPDDRQYFLQYFVKEDILESLDEHGNFTMTFRMMFREGPMYVRLKITRMIEEEARHVVIGISNVDEELKARQAYAEAQQASLTYSRVAQALAGDYFSIYVVDPVTDDFFQYSATKEFDSLEVEKEGRDFFNVSRKNMERLIYDGDRERFMAIFKKERIMAILERDGSFTMKYRLMFSGTPVFVSMKATLMEDDHGQHLIIGTNNIDAQMKRETEYQQRMAEAKTSARNDFLANMSHDIRTPMNAIVGYTNIARSRRDDPEAVMEAVEKIGSSSHFLLSLINDILDISKIESGKMQVSTGPCNLGEIFRRIEDITALQAQKKSLKVTYCRDTVRHYKVLGDELRIEQVLINIVSNAIKYTPAGKSVELIAEERPGKGKVNKYRFIVRDTGIGISEEYLPHIFESFTREESTKINRVQGTGLGLAITAKVVEMMKGTISVKSVLGEGSEFTVDLDLESMEEETPEVREEEESVSLEGRRILLVEDNIVNAEIASVILEQFGVKVDVAENGKIGYETVRDAGPGTYDAVLMDIQMPVMNGYESTRAIRTLEGDYFAALPVIAMSANAYDEDVKDCLAAGMNAHIAKPFQPDALVKLLCSYIHSGK